MRLLTKTKVGLVLLFFAGATPFAISCGGRVVEQSGSAGSGATGTSGGGAPSGSGTTSGGGGLAPCPYDSSPPSSPPDVDPEIVSECQTDCDNSNKCIGCISSSCVGTCVFDVTSHPECADVTRPYHQCMAAHPGCSTNDCVKEYCAYALCFAGGNSTTLPSECN